MSAEIATGADRDAAGGIGAVRAILRNGRHVGPNKLYALEGIVRGVRRQATPVEERRRLWADYRQTRNTLV